MRRPPGIVEVAEPLPEPLNEPDRAKFVGLVPLRFNESYSVR
jgi:hypothetical protein